MYAAWASGVLFKAAVKFGVFGSGTSLMESVQVQFLPAVRVWARLKLTSRVALGVMDVKALLLYGGIVVLAL